MNSTLSRELSVMLSDMQHHNKQISKTLTALKRSSSVHHIHKSLRINTSPHKQHGGGTKATMPVYARERNSKSMKRCSSCVTMTKTSSEKSSRKGERAEQSSSKKQTKHKPIKTTPNTKTSLMEKVYLGVRGKTSPAKTKDITKKYMQILTERRKGKC